MPLSTLPFLPVPAGYAASELPAARLIEVEGGPPRGFADMLDPAGEAKVTYNLRQSQYLELEAFYRDVARGGEVSFLANVISGGGEVSLQEVNLVPGSVQVSYQGDRALVSVSYEIKPYDTSGDENIVALWEDPGGDELSGVLAALEKLVNIDLPAL